MANVLIVDDSKASRRHIRRAVESAGHTVAGEEDNGESGYLKYKEIKPDIVTMDIVMPGLGGLEALQLIKESDENARVIVISAAAQKEKVARAMEIGALQFIPKPCTEQEISQAVDDAANLQ